MCVFLMADLGETTAFLLPSRRHLSQNRPPAHENELGTSVGDLPCEACRRFPAGNMRTHVQVSPSQGYMVFEAPKGTQFRSLHWKAGDSLTIEIKAPEAKELPTELTTQALVVEPPASSHAVEYPASRLEVTGYIETEERDPNDPSVEPEDPVIEWIKFQFPDGIINGESPLVQEGELLWVGFTLNSDKQPIEKIRLSMRELLDFNIAEYEYFYKAEIPAKHNQTIDLREHIRGALPDSYR